VSSSKRITLALALATAALTAVACGAPAEEESESGEDAVVQEGDFYGDDRVAAVLKGHPELIPASFEDFEKTFGVGRSCARVDSKEVFIVEESQTRLAGPKELHEITKTKLMPRAVITGCNTGDLSDPSTVKNSYGLMAALISDPDMHDTAKGDTIRMWPLEVIAIDNTTGLFNYYVFEPAVMPADPWAVLPKDTKGRVTRVYRAKETRPDKAGFGQFNVFERRLEKGKAATAEAQPIGGGNRCFNCHVNGAPLMNEMQDPWTNWVSFKKTLPAAQLFGPTKVLVSEAIPNASVGTSSLANDLEPIMRSAIQAYTFGTTKTNGWANKTLTGELPGGVSKMLESVFCETELNYVSASQSLPLELFVDLDAAGPSSITPPPSFGDDKTPFEFPVRSVRDKETESWLIQKKFLSAATAMAVRLLDDENDVFAPARCNLLPEITKNLGSDPTKVDERIRTVVTSKLGSLTFKTTQPKRAAYIKSLLTPGIRREVAQREYLEELTTRFNALDKSDAAVTAKEKFRKSRARAKFNTRSSPLPILDAPR
jgi:hypothetical protein